MAAKKDKYDKKYDKELAAILRELDAIYADLANEIGNIGATYAGSVDKSVPFVLSKYPLIQKRVEAVIKKLARRMRTTVVNGVRSAWTLANQKNNELCNIVFGEMVKSLTEDQERRYYTSNGAALDAFLKRKVHGLGLSDRVWNYADECIQMVESTLELGIKTGEGAPEMARDLKTYLKFPDKLFRRVRGADGNLHLSKAAAQFHPGQGVYRSSYKNAYRLARTETNMAYRTADHMRRTQLDFVVGIEIHLSNNHTCLGADGKPHPFHDICDDLEGKYPKWFEFRGWHPACRCFTTSILKTDEEIDRDMDGVDRGSVNTVKEMPPQWNDWLAKNRGRVDAAAARGTLPYFLVDNPWAWQEGVDPPWIKAQQTQSILQRAHERHMARTPEQVADIRARWQERQIAYNDARLVLKLADSIPDLKDAWTAGGKTGEAERIDRLRNMYETGKFTSYANLELAARAVLQDIKTLRDSFDTLEDPFGTMKTYGVEKTRAVHEAVESKLSYFDSHGDLDWKIKKLKFEIDWLEKPENQKYSTWKVAQDAYRKALEEAELQKFWNDVGANVGHFMSVAQAKYPVLYAQMRVAYKNRDIVVMQTLINEVKEEERWANNIATYNLFDSQPIYWKLQGNNTGFTFMTDMKDAIAHRKPIVFSKAKKFAEEALKRYNDLKSEANSLIAKLRSYHTSEEAAAADNLEQAIDSANLVEIDRLTRDAEELAKWADLRGIYAVYANHDAAKVLDAANHFGYLQAAERALDAKDESAFRDAIKGMADAVAKYNDYVNDAKAVHSQLVHFGQISVTVENELEKALADDIAKTKALADELERTVNNYVLSDIKEVLDRANKLADWIELETKALEIIDNPDIIKVLESYEKGNLVQVIKDMLEAHDEPWLSSSIKQAQAVWKQWEDLTDKAYDLTGNSLPANIADEISDAISSHDKNVLEAAIARAERYMSVFGPMLNDLKNLEAKQLSLEQKIEDQKSALKKKRTDIASKRKTVTEEAARIKATYPSWDEKDLKKYVPEWQENEKKRSEVNAEAKSLRDMEAKLADAETNYKDNWSDTVDFAHLAIEQENEAQAKIAIKVLRDIANAIEDLSGETQWDADNYTQERKDNAFWAKIDPANGIYDSQDAMRAADGMLRKVAGEKWEAATEKQKDAIYAYTSSYHNIQEPLRGLTYYGSSSSTTAGLARIPEITALIETSSYDFDMWVQRFDDKMSLMKFGINPFQPITDAMMNSLVGKTGTEGGFQSAGCAKGGGYKAGRNITYNIYCPKGTKMMYIEPISACGNGSGRSWDGKSGQHSFGSEIEALIQRGTTFRIIKVEKSGTGSFDNASWFIDMEVIAQKPLPFPYSGGKYPYTKFEP